MNDVLRNLFILAGSGALLVASISNDQIAAIVGFATFYAAFKLFPKENGQ